MSRAVVPRRPNFSKILVLGKQLEVAASPISLHHLDKMVPVARYEGHLENRQWLLPQAKLARSIYGDVQAVVADLLHKFLASAELAGGEHINPQPPVAL